MSGRVAKLDAQISAISRKTGLSECGKDWLIAALDPFHDTQLPRLEGIPDLADSPSVVQCIKQTMTISCPAAITTGTWDCHVIDLPFDNLQSMGSAQIGGYATGTIGAGSAGNSFVNYPTGGNLRSFGGLTAVAVQTGQSTNPVAPPQNQISSLVTPGAFSTGNYRKVASGFEVLSVGPKLYKSGTVYAYRSSVPSFDNTSTLAFNASNNTTGAITQGPIYNQFLHIPSPPFFAADAEVMPGTRSWEAEKGVYIVSRFNTSKAPRMNSNYSQPIMVDSATSNNTSPQSSVSMPTLTYVSTGTTPVQQYGWDPCVWNNQDISGAYFTGLNLQDVLTINYNIYIERFPTISDQNLLVLATPSPPMDDLALEIYSQVSRLMPVGVPQAENGLGDWFKGIVSTISNVVSPIAKIFGMATGNPVAHAIGGAADLAGYISGKSSAQLVKENRALGKFASTAGRELTAPNSYSNPFNGLGLGTVARRKGLSARSIVKELDQEEKREMSGKTKRKGNKVPNAPAMSKKLTRELDSLVRNKMRPKASLRKQIRVKKFVIKNNGKYMRSQRK